MGINILALGFKETCGVIRVVDMSRVKTSVRYKIVGRIWEHSIPLVGLTILLILFMSN